MAKHKPDTSEYLPEWDDGTYQTGAIHPPTPSSGLVAFLLVTVIFLGGICSALGIVNIRLLQQLLEVTQETTPVSVDTRVEVLPTKNPLENLEIQPPTLPQNAALQLQMVQSPYFSEKSPQVMTGQQVYDANAQSLVDVLCLTYFSETETGIGMVIGSNGYILTNSHLVESAKRIFVTTADGATYRATLVGSDSFSDLAVLYIEAQNLVPCRFSSNTTLLVTEPTFAVEADRTIRQSTVFSAGHTFSSKTHSITLIQTCSGSASGPVFNSYGYVIGFQVGNVARYFPTANTQGTGLVIPTATIARIVSTLVSDGLVSGRPCLGVQVEEISKVYQQYWHLPGGLLLTRVEENSSAAACGLREGDILLALDGHPVNNSQDMYSALYNLQVGDTAVAVVFRDNQKFTVKLTIEDNAHSE
ncbi:MAG: serine protease [Oscillospiraceae bacterium]|nr:serine protease [Oscillospiraceae bacterium]